MVFSYTYNISVTCFSSDATDKFHERVNYSIYRSIHQRRRVITPDGSEPDRERVTTTDKTDQLKENER